MGQISAWMCHFKAWTCNLQTRKNTPPKNGSRRQNHFFQLCMYSRGSFGRSCTSPPAMDRSCHWQCHANLTPIHRRNWRRWASIGDRRVLGRDDAASPFSLFRSCNPVDESPPVPVCARQSLILERSRQIASSWRRWKPLRKDFGEEKILNISVCYTIQSMR